MAATGKAAQSARIAYAAPVTWGLVHLLRRLEEAVIRPSRWFLLSWFILKLVLIVPLVVVVEDGFQSGLLGAARVESVWIRLGILSLVALVAHAALEALVHRLLHQLAARVVDKWVPWLSRRAAEARRFDLVGVVGGLGLAALLVLVAAPFLRGVDPRVLVAISFLLGIAINRLYQGLTPLLTGIRVDQGDPNLVYAIQGRKELQYRFSVVVDGAVEIASEIAAFAFGVKGPKRYGRTRREYMQRLHDANHGVFAALKCEVSSKTRGTPTYTLRRTVIVGYVSVIPLTPEVVPWYLGDADALRRYGQESEALRRNQVSQFEFGDRDIVPVGEPAPAIYFQALVNLSFYRWHSLRIPKCGPPLIRAALGLARRYGEFGRNIRVVYAEATTDAGQRVIQRAMGGAPVVRSGRALTSREGWPICERTFESAEGKALADQWNGVQPL